MFWEVGKWSKQIAKSYKVFKILGNVTNVMLFFRSKGVATPLLRKNRKKKTLHLQHYQIL
jgi:hypothetical protein